MHVFQILKQKENDDKNKMLLGQADLFEFDEPPVYGELEQLERKISEAKADQEYVRILNEGKVDKFKT